MGAQIRLSKEECARGMGQSPNDAAVKDVQIRLSKEECVLSMVQRPNDAALKGAPNTLKEEECASNMEQHGQRKDAAEKDAQTLLWKEECAEGTEQKSNYAVTKDAQNNLHEEDYAGDTLYDSELNVRLYGTLGGVSVRVSACKYLCRGLNC